MALNLKGAAFTVRTREIMTGLSAILFLFGLLALSPSVTRAQDAQGWYSWDVGPSAGPETKSQPLNLAGCWGGTEQDQGGPGQLFINFVQRANKITKGSDGGIAFSNGQHVSGPVTGSVTSSNFHVGFHRGSCNVSFSGTLPGG